MQNSKLYITLKSLDKIEQNRLRKYLCSPYFNTNQALINLFEFLTAELNGEDQHSLDKDSLWFILERTNLLMIRDSGNIVPICKN